jgi:hypothetical protein
VPTTPPPKPARAPKKIAPTRAARIGRGKLIIAVVAIAAIVAVLGWYFLAGPGRTGSKLEITFTPSTLHVGDHYSDPISVTNNESGTMTLSGGTAKIYRNDQLLDTISVTEFSSSFLSQTIPPGKTVILDEASGTVKATDTYGGVTYSNVGNWKMEISLETNFGTLTSSCSWTVLA